MTKSKVLVTGGGSGIGRAACRLFEANGSAVAVLDRNLPENGQIRLTADVSDEGQMTAAFDRLATEWGSIDTVVANAGINGVWCPIAEMTSEEWHTTMRVNLFGTFLTSRLSLPLLKDGGSIVIVASINGSRTFSNAGATAYATSKAGQVAFAKMLALELAPRRIRVNVVCPGAIQTNIAQNMSVRNTEGIKHPRVYPAGEVPLTGGGPGTAESVAEAIYFLASPAASHITGTEMYVDGGESLVF
ncbi:3-ketoacyl-ACP reductase [Bryobacterales bacterium F-183]|nr:3-ketoacyl-ACP reductase [Bryobacterales bacterium F-183]